MLKLGAKLIPDVLVEYTKSKLLRTIPISIPNSNHKIKQTTFSNLERAVVQTYPIKIRNVQATRFLILGRGRESG
jgi:hypothetical protein